jgi:erythromycin esterase
MRVFVLVLILTVPATLICAQQSAVTQTQTPTPAETKAIQDWLAGHAVPLHAIQAGNGYRDLTALKDVLKDARIVALGEATHGTREFFQFKHRMLEFLVTQMGFNIFAIEASFPACQRINDYVLYGRGDPAMALAGQGFRVWDTEEVRDLIEWLRQYNAGVPENKRVQFIGFDMQRYPYAFKIIKAYLQKTAPEKIADAEAAFEPLRFDQDEIVKFTKTAQHDSIAPPVHALGSWLDRNREQLIKKSSPAEFATVRQNVRVLEQFVESFAGNISTSKRDEYMAENVRWIVDTLGPKARIVLWAHNAHIQTATQGPGVASMGSYLRKTYGPAYYALGFTFNQGSFQSRELLKDGGFGGMKEFKVGAAPEFSVGWYFSNAARAKHLQNYIVNFRGAPTDGPVGQWLSTAQPLYSMGGVYSDDWKPEQHIASAVLGQEFDGLIFIEQTTRARPNPTAINRPPRPEE